MKIRDAKQAYSAQLRALQSKRQNLSKLLEESERSGAGNFDRVELSRALSTLDKQYEAAQGAMEGILATENAIRDGEAARQQNEALSKQAEEMAKMMEVFRRISSGAKVPAEDEQRLMEFNPELYMAAKAAAILVKKNDEEYDSLWQDEGDPGETPDAQELAANTEISVAAPEAVAAEAAPADGGA